MREPTQADPIVKGVPHGGQIDQVAVTEQGDAALTFDTIGGVRLWPALDGTRTPLPLAIVAPRQLALAHAGRDLLAAVLDDAGSVRVLRLGRDGSVRGDLQLPSPIAYAQVVALGDGVLARSVDQRIEWFAADSTSRGTLAAEPGTRIEAIAARDGGAIAVTTDGTTYALRWLHTMAGELTWGATMTLPAAVQDGAIALSPSHRRIALVDSSSTLSVYEVGLVPVRIGSTLRTRSTDLDIGFIDEDHVAVVGDSSMQWWSLPAKPSNDPWAVTTPSLPVPSHMQTSVAGAFADGIAVTGFGSALALIDAEHVRYLGYKEQGTGSLGVAPGSLWLSMSTSHVLWLDDKLAPLRDIELREGPSAPWVYAMPIGDRHVVAKTAAGGTYKLVLVDVEDRDHPIDLGTYPTVDRIEVSPDGRLLAVAASNRVHRFALDLATNSVHELPELKVRGSFVSLRLLDPEQADGMIAISVGWVHQWDEDYTLTVYREHGPPKSVKRSIGRVIDVDAAGNVYLVVGNSIQIRHGTEKVGSIELERATRAAAVSADGSRFAVQSGNDIVVLDRAGTEQWRRTLWGTGQLVFTRDGEHLVARANGGIVLFDAATGEPNAIECGWSFGLMTTPPATSTLAAAPVCEDLML